MTAMLRNIDMAGQKEKGARRNLAGGEDVSARRVGSAFPKPGNPDNLRRLQHRERLVMSGFVG
jgi:hypothetical protein